MYYDLNYLKGQTIAGTKQKQLGLAFLRFFFFLLKLPKRKMSSVCLNKRETH